MTKAHTRKPTVLVVDDAAAVSTTLVWVLRESGYDCTAAGSRSEALHLCTRLAPDLALIEMNLPDGSGMEAARDLRRHVPGCKMLLMSGDPDTLDNVTEARLAGVNCDVLPKPIAVEELLQRVKDALAQPA
jgi:DNA-binding response OmpR family regulator